jgi:hypothetical protein
VPIRFNQIQFRRKAMAHTHSDLLRVANEHDAQLQSRSFKITNAMKHAGEQVATPGVPVHELKMDIEDEDPFNGNLNNRRVAARIARQGHILTANHENTVNPYQIGDAKKAHEDVQKSLAVNPDPQVPSGDDAAVQEPPVTPGSPAARRRSGGRKAAQASKAAPTWEDNDTGNS